MNPKFTLTLDSSQITTFLECPTMWEHSYKERLGLTVTPSSEAMNAGTYGHKLLEIYYAARLGGETLNQAMERAFAFDIDKYFCECGHAQEDHKRVDDLILEETQIINCCKKCSIVNRCNSWKSKPYQLSQDQRYSVRERLREYFYTYVNNDFLPNNQQALEVGFAEPILEDKDNLFVLEGRIDMIGTLQGLPAVIDHKFQQRAHALYKKSVQFKNYALVTRIPMVIVNYIRLTKGVSKDTLVRDIVTFNSIEMHAWKKELISIFFRVKTMIMLNKFDQNWSACGGKYGYNCIYTPLCEEFNSELVQIKKQQIYVKKELWSPW